MSESAVPTGLRPRTLSRFFAFQALYQLAVAHEPVDRSLRQTWDSEDARLRADAPIRAFASQLASLAVEHLDTIDRLIEQYATQRALHRMAMVDLALLRTGCAELLYLSDAPPPVVINETVELAKMFGADESPAFINAALDAIQRHRDEIPASEKATSQWVSGDSASRSS